MDEVTIIETTPNRPDVIALIQALDDELRSRYPPENCHLLDIAALMDPGVYFLVAEIDGLAVGTGALLRGDGYAEVKRMYVAPAYRGRGIASRVLAALETQAARDGFRLVKLETGVRQPEALRLYEKAGYQVCDRFGNYPDAALSVFFEKSVAVDARATVGEGR